MNLNELSAAELSALKALVTDALHEKAKAALPEKSTHHVDLTVRVRGTVTRGATTTRASTSKLLNLGTVALLLRRAGITREKSEEVLREVLTEAASLDEAARTVLVTDYKLEETIEAVEKSIVATVPRSTVAGRITTKLDVEVERNEAEVVAA